MDRSDPQHPEIIKKHYKRDRFRLKTVSFLLCGRLPTDSSVRLPFFSCFLRSENVIAPRDGKDAWDDSGGSRRFDYAATGEHSCPACRQIVDKNDRFSDEIRRLGNVKAVLRIALSFLPGQIFLHFAASGTSQSERNRKPGRTGHGTAEFHGMIVAVLPFCSVTAGTRNEDSGFLFLRSQRFPDRLREIAPEKVENALQMLLFQSVQNPVFGKISVGRLILIEFDQTAKSCPTEWKRRTGATATRLKTSTARFLFGVFVGIVTGPAKDFVAIRKQITATNAFRGIDQFPNAGQDR